MAAKGKTTDGTRDKTAVAREAETIAWNEVRVAAHPDLDGLLALIDEFRRDAGLGA